MSDSEMPLSLIPRLLLAIPIALIVGLVLRWIWVPVAGTLLAPLAGLTGPEFDVAAIRTHVVLAAMAGTVIGWLWINLRSGFFQ